MKKLTAIILSLVLILSLSIPAMAATVNEKGNQTADVKAKYVDAVNRPAVYSVDVSWSNMEMTYTVTGEKTWDPETHTYSGETTGTWGPEEATIQIHNHSNVDVKVSWQLTVEDAYKNYFKGFLRDMSDTMEDELMTSKVLAAAVENNANSGGNTVVTLLKSGLNSEESTLPETITEMTKIATITLTIE